MNTIEALQKILEFDGQVHIHGIPLDERQRQECEEIVGMFSASDDPELLIAVGLCLETMSDSDSVTEIGTDQFLMRS